MTASSTSDQHGRWTPRRVQVGEWQVTALADGSFRLDGGAMWGVVPAALWRAKTPPAEDNTIPLAIRPFLAERGDDKVLIEVGLGDRWSAKERRIYHIDPEPSLDSSLAACGVAPHEITHVVASHCHWDHIGAQVVERDGRLEPHFPQVRHFAPRVEVEMASHPDHVRRGSYRPEDVRVIAEAGLLETYEGSTELLPGIRAHEVGGHSDGVSLITIAEDEPGATAVFWTDVVPTTHHIQPPYVMAFDIDVVRSFEQRSRWLERAAEEDWIGLFYHDADVAFGRLRRDDRGRYQLEAIG
jgi:glyoxylase-like metal-dependent hydrolase (beta-lactamase superfamily II)